MQCLAARILSHSVYVCIYIYIAEPLVREPSPLEDENIIVTSKVYKSRDIYQILPELIQGGKNFTF